MNIELWSLGKPNDSFINEGVELYLKKIKPYCNISLEIIQNKQAGSNPEANRQAEEKLILKKLQPGHRLVLLDERGSMYTSPELADLIQSGMNQSVRTLVFLIGGAYGVSDKIKERADHTWSLSKLVFPHQLVRLILAEQVYRSFSILNHLPYHHS